MKTESNRPVALEDLLRLKRAERPAAEFWTEFDRSLRAKQLAALVEKRPWWQRLPRDFAGLARYRVPLGATAVLALTLVSIREYRSSAPAEPRAVPASTEAAPMVAAVETAPEVAANVAEVPVTGLPVAAATTTEEISAPPAVAVETEAAGPAELSRMTPLGGAASLESEPEALSPSARIIAANLASLQSTDPVSSRNLLSAASGFEARAMPVRVAVEPLQQMTPPGESRRSRLLTAMVSTESLETSSRTTERAASRIAEDRLYDQIRRFGARGDRFQVKF